MKVISTTNLSREGNDCYIYQSVSLIEAFGMYTVIVADRTTGWCDRKTIYCQSEVTTDFNKARLMYKQVGGILED